MSPLILLWAAIAAALVFSLMLVAVLIARTMDDSSQEGQRKVAGQISDLAARARKDAEQRAAAGQSAWLSAKVASALAQVSASLDRGARKPDAGEPAPDDAGASVKSFMVGLAIAGGVLAAIVGFITG